jgi:tetratricopeptide (TPR) repeat protein
VEVALFDADHGRPGAALAAARAEWARRRSVHVADALAWALHANGRDREAVRYADLALRLGTRDASFLFHAGMIRLALGDRALALDLLRRARATNPWFSVRWSPVLDRVLERLDGSGATGP